jgi:hypothetical protein
MEILTEDQHRALAFIDACNNQRYAPSADEVERWLEEPATPPGPWNFAARWTRTGLERGKVTDQLVRLGWVLGDGGGLYTLPLGQALLQDAEVKTAEVLAATTVILGSNDPLAYGTLMSELAAAGAGMLVDPYIRREQLLHLVQDTTLDRLLISRKVGKRDLAGVRALLGHLPAGRELEVRVAAEAHDRYLKAEDGGVFVIGSSMGMVSAQKATTVFTPIPSDGREVIGKMLEDQWAASQPLRPEEDTTVPDGSDSAGDGE